MAKEPVATIIFEALAGRRALDSRNRLKNIVYGVEEFPRHQNTRTADCSIRSRRRGWSPSFVVIDGRMKLVLEKELDPDQAESIEAARWVVVDEEVDVAIGSGLVARGRAVKIKRRRSHGLYGWNVRLQLS